MSSEVRLKHLELILGYADDGPEGGAIRVSWPALALRPRRDLHGEQRDARRRGLRARDVRAAGPLSF